MKSPADGHAACGQQGGEGSGVDPERADHHDDQDDRQGDGHETGDERSHRTVGLPALEHLLETVLDALDDPRAGDVDGQRGQDFESELEGGTAETLQGRARVRGQLLRELLQRHLGRIGLADELLLGDGTGLNQKG